MKGDDIARRLLRFASATIRIVTKLSRGPARTVVVRQLLRAGTAGGANYEEARSAESRLDFAHKVLVASKELCEAVYWLELILDAELSRDPAIPPTIDEGRQLIAILKASARTARSRHAALSGAPD